MKLGCILGHAWFKCVENGQDVKICDTCHKRKVIKDDFKSDNYEHERNALDRSKNE